MRIFRDDKITQTNYCIWNCVYVFIFELLFFTMQSIHWFCTKFAVSTNSGYA